MRVKWKLLMVCLLLCIKLCTVTFFWRYHWAQNRYTSETASLISKTTKTVSSSLATPQVSKTEGNSTVNSEPVLSDAEILNNTISTYYDEERIRCELETSNRTGINWCPCVPPNLLGRIAVNMVDDNDWNSIRDSVGEDVLAGGEWKPEHCVSRTRLAMIIPCRDREVHLRILLKHIYPILKRQLVQFRIFAISQRYPAIFNKAALMNIAFLEAKKMFNFNCVIFQDVDMLLEDDRPLMTCGSEPRHYARSVSRLGYKSYTTFGGVTSIKPELFETVNGFPLRYFGWGGEDDEMWSKLSRFSTLYKLPSAIARYSTIPHVKDATNANNPKRHSLMQAAYEKAENHSFEGLSDLIYEVNDIQMEPLFTRIEADINATWLQYPKHPEFQYIDVWGACVNSSFVETLTGIGWASCKYLCDISTAIPCVGFSYFNGTCETISKACDLLPARNAKTFIRIWRSKAYDSLGTLYM